MTCKCGCGKTVPKNYRGDIDRLYYNNKHYAKHRNIARQEAKHGISSLGYGVNAPDDQTNYQALINSAVEGDIKAIARLKQLGVRSAYHEGKQVVFSKDWIEPELGTLRRECYEG